MQVDWMKKNLKKHFDLTTRVNLVQNLLKTKELPVKTGAALLDINRTSVYYKGTSISQEELDCKSIIDRLHADNPAWGARQLSAQLKKRGHQVGRRKTRRYMNKMGIDPIYPKMNLSKRMQQAKVCPYLLRNAVIDRPNQAWSIDITYIAIKHGFLYLTAVIDWYSRCIVGWAVDDTLDTRMVITALKKAFMVVKPIILNSDQGCQFTSNEYMNFLKENQIRQSMDGKSRWVDNIMIERCFSFKYEEAYLTQYNNIREVRKTISKYAKYIISFTIKQLFRTLRFFRYAHFYLPCLDKRHYPALNRIRHRRKAKILANFFSRPRCFTEQQKIFHIFIFRITGYRHLFFIQLYNKASSLLRKCWWTQAIPFHFHTNGRNSRITVFRNIHYFQGRSKNRISGIRLNFS